VTAIPQVSYSVTQNFVTGETQLHRYGKRLDLEKIAIDDYDKTTKGLKQEHKNVQHFISKLKTIAVENCHIRDLLKVSQSILQQCIKNSEEIDTETENCAQKNIVTLRFINEQLKLVCFEKRKYSPAIIRLAMMIKFYSSSGYRALRDSRFMILPSESTLYSYMVPKRDSGVNQQRLNELSQVAKDFPTEKREVSIVFDEMALQPNVNFDASGQMEGFATNKNCDNAQLATSMLCFMIQGLKLNFHEIVFFHPVHNLDSQFLQLCFLQAINLVMKSGFRPILAVCDNHTVNRKMYRNISRRTDDELMFNPVIVNPYNSSEKIILIHDSVHILKCLRNNWFRKPYWKQDDESQISWKLLDVLLEHEKEMPIRKAHNLSTKAVKPNNMEKQKVKLAYNVVSWPVRNALIFYCESNPELFPQSDVDATVGFMDASRTFFDILNINHIKKGPICSENSAKVEELKAVQTYFQTIQSSDILTKETFQALQQTISGSLEVINLLLQSDPGKVKVFTARLQFHK